MSRPVYGYIYETILRGQADGEHSYVGMCTTTINRRVHGPSGHTSPASVARDPWKAGISPGAAGFRRLEVVRDTGDPAENDRALRRAEAFWIDRLRPVHNDVRPVRPPVTAKQPPRRRPRPVREPARRSPRERRRVRRTRGRIALLVTLLAVGIYLSARVLVAMQLPWPAAPWVGAPAVGSALAWIVYEKITRTIRKLTR